MDVAFSVAVAVLATAGLCVVARKRRGIISPRGVVMIHSWAATTVAGIFAFGIPAAVVAAVVALPQNRNPDALLNGGVAAGIVVIPAVWFFCEGLRRRLLLVKDGLVDVKRSGRRRRIRWSEVSSVTYSSVLGCYFVKVEDGRAVVVSQLLVGQRDFAEAVLDNVRASAVECEYQLRQVIKG